MNMPATKLATKGTLDARDVSPSGPSMSTKFVMFLMTESNCMLKVPTAIKYTAIATKIAMVSAMPEILLNRCPAK